MEKIRSAVIGAGYLGKFHAQKYAALPNVELVAVVDQSLNTATAVAEPLATLGITDYDTLLGEVDAVSIVVPTYSHFEIARDFLQNGAHVLVEKPITSTPDEAQQLLRIANSCSRILQVGHLERFNAAVLAMDEYIHQPRFIESHRLSPFRARGTEVNVILDLMIHDIDLILSMVDSEISAIDAAGMSVLSKDIDIANARLRFNNGCVANVTASRVSDKTERKLRIFQKNAYMSADLANHQLKVYQHDVTSDSPGIVSTAHTFDQNDALMLEIQHFIECIIKNSPPKVTGLDGLRALQTATEITRLLTQHEAH